MEKYIQDKLVNTSSIVIFIQNKIDEYRENNIKKLKILFLLKENNIKDINNNEYNIHFEIYNNIQYFEILELIKNIMYIKLKQEPIKNYINNKSEYLGYIVTIKMKKISHCKIL